MKIKQIIEVIEEVKDLQLLMDMLKDDGYDFDDIEKIAKIDNAILVSLPNYQMYEIIKG